jgi:hypothetical protein
VIGTTKRNSYPFEDSVSSNSASFSDLNGSIKEETTTRSNLQSKLRQMREEEIPSPSEQEFGVLNQSIFSSRLDRPKISAKESSSPEAEDYNPINYDKSFYMTQNVPVAPPKEPENVEK